jgi:SynChlorMet cassette radical SAM/SPASM protein ScmF
LDYGLFVQAIEEGLSLGLTSVKLTGGEPLLHPDFFRIIDLLRLKNLNVTIETNGMLVDLPLARVLKEQSTLRHISVSLDGAKPETHDAFRGGKGSFHVACQAIRYLVEVGYRPQVIMSLHRDNVSEIEDLVRLAENLGAGSVKLGIIQPNGRGELLERQRQVLDVEQIIELGKWVRTNLSKNTSIPVNLNWPMAFFNINRLMCIEGCQCDLFGTLGILPSGHLSLCGLGVLVPDLCLGMLGRDRVEDIWVCHPVLVEVRKKVPTGMEGICANCLLQNQCNGG